MSDSLTRCVAVLLLLVQAVASLGRGESLCIPLEDCGEHASAHRHVHESFAGRAVVAHRHGLGDRPFAAEQVHHACDHGHDHTPEYGETASDHDHHGDRAAETAGDPEACCGDHLHFNLSDHDLPPRSGSAADLLVLAIELPTASSASIAIRAVIVPREAAVGQSWIRSDQRRTIDVASIVV